MRAIVTGGAGFIGSHIVERLVSDGAEVVVMDRIPQNLAKNLSGIDPRDYTYVEGDIGHGLGDHASGVDIIFHLAANSDIRIGLTDPHVDVDDTLGTTLSVLNAAREFDVPRIFFSSSSAVYGISDGPLPEDPVSVRPVSIYGAMKLSSEAAVSAYSSLYGFNATIIRFPNVVGPRMTHGVICDFVSKLRMDPTRLEILGDGRQRKQYLHVSDLVEGTMLLTSRGGNGVETFNLSADSSTEVDTIAEIVCRKMGLHDVEFTHTGGECGWRGDIPRFSLDTTKARATGWTHLYDSTRAVELAVDSVLNDE